MRRRLAAFKLALGAIVGGTFSQWRTFKANSYHYHLFSLRSRLLLGPSQMKGVVVCSGSVVFFSQWNFCEINSG
jgi:hypothetical protein